MRYPVTSAMSHCVRPGAFSRLRLCSAGSPFASGHLGIRSPTGQQFASGCSPPRLAATQLPSTSRGHSKPRGGDFHPADIAPSWAHRAGYGSARALAQTVISLIAEKPSPQEVVYRVDSNGSGLKLSPGPAVPGSPGVWLTSFRVNGPVEKLLYFRVCLDRGRENRLVSVPPPSEPDWRFSRIRLSG